MLLLIVSLACLGCYMGAYYGIFECPEDVLVVGLLSAVCAALYSIASIIVRGRSVDKVVLVLSLITGFTSLALPGYLEPGVPSKKRFAEIRLTDLTQIALDYYSSNQRWPQTFDDVLDPDRLVRTDPFSRSSGDFILHEVATDDESSCLVILSVGKNGKYDHDLDDSRHFLSQPKGEVIHAKIDIYIVLCPPEESESETDQREVSPVPQ